MSVVAKHSSSDWKLVLLNRQQLLRTDNSSQYQLSSQTGASDLPVHSDSYDCPCR